MSAAGDYNAGVDFRVDAITLDLDDTLWPFAPIGARIERTLHDWFLARSPRTGRSVNSPSRQAGSAISACLTPSRNTRLCGAQRADPQTTAIRSTASGNSAAQW